MKKKCGCHKVGAFSPSDVYGGLTMEQIAYLGVGALGSKAIVNPLKEQLFKDKKDPNSALQKWFGVAVKMGIAAAAITQSNDENVNMLGWGAFAAGALEAAEIALPNVFAAVQGIGSTIDLNDSDWQYLSGYGDDYNGVGAVVNNEFGVGGAI